MAAATGAARRAAQRPPFDVMGFAAARRRYLASGHPGDEQDLPARPGPAGIPDGGRTWTTVSLEGEVDFHRLVASGRTVVGLGCPRRRHAAPLRRRRSDLDRDLGQPPFFDLALDPEDPDRVIATTQDGPVLSTDGAEPLHTGQGRARGRPAGVERIRAVRRGPRRDRAGLHRPGHDLAQKGRVGAGQPSAIGADGDRVAVLAGNTIVESTDGGATLHRPNHRPGRSLTIAGCRRRSR